jgi:excisionase family DNA binding protein
MHNAERSVQYAEPQLTSEERGSLVLAMRPREAAKALGISQRLLWSWTNQGRIPHLRIGKAVIYPVDELRGWLEGQSSLPASNRRRRT